MGRSNILVFCTPIDVADEAFRAMCAGPDPLALHGSEFSPVLPARLIVLDEVKTLLVDGDVPQAVCDAVWAEVVRRSRADATWRLGAVGMAIPALRRAAGSLARGYDGDAEELDAEVLAGFLERLVVVDVDAPGIANKLRWAGWRGGHEAIVAHRREQAAAKATVGESGAPATDGHPDDVLARAVAAGAISPTDADLISATRIGGSDMAEYAAELGLSYNAVKIRRQRAEARLVAFLTDGPRPTADETRTGGVRAGLAAAAKRIGAADADADGVRTPTLTECGRLSAAGGSRRL